MIEVSSAQRARPTVSVVVPVYNSEATLAELVARLDDVLRLAATRFELILVDDDSRDASWSLIAELARRYATIRGIA